MEAKLVVLAPAEIVNTEFNLQLPVTIGRGRDAKIKLVHGQISRLHCELYEDNGKLKARDLGSLNGTFVDGERISDETLKPGGLLNIGSVTFRAVYGNMPPRRMIRRSSSVRRASRIRSARLRRSWKKRSPALAQPKPKWPKQRPTTIWGCSTLPKKHPLRLKLLRPAPVAPPPPAPAMPAAYEEATISIPAPAKAAPPAAPAAPAFMPPAEPAKEADVDDWLNIADSGDSDEKKTEDDDLNSFFNNLK